MINKEELNYPKHKHPHGVENIPPNDYRIWVCEECKHIFTDNETRAGLNGWGHPCKSHPCRKGQRCESHLEPYLPELPALLSKEEEAIRELLKEAHNELDDINSSFGKKYMLCLYCGSREYNHQGIIHTEDCLITRIRQALKEPRKEKDDK